MLDILKDGHEEGGGDGDGAGQQHPGEAGPAQIQEALQRKRAAVGEKRKETSSVCVGVRVG